MAIEVKQATELAAKYLVQLLDGVENIKFEEFEIVDGGPGAERMDITLSFDLRATSQSISMQLPTSSPRW